jgi:hypothetical protein
MQAGLQPAQLGSRRLQARRSRPARRLARLHDDFDNLHEPVGAAGNPIHRPAGLHAAADCRRLVESPVVDALGSSVSWLM